MSTKADIRQAYLQLQIDYEKLKVENATQKFKLAQYEEEIRILEKKLKDKIYTDSDSLVKKNAELSEELRLMKFNIDNNTTVIELKTENTRLSAAVKVKEDEIKYLKHLIDTYRNMPHVKEMIENLSSLAVPNIDKLRDFIKTIDEGKMTELIKLLEENNNSLSYILHKIS